MGRVQGLDFPGGVELERHARFVGWKGHSEPGFRWCLSLRVYAQPLGEGVGEFEGDFPISDLLALDLERGEGSVEGEGGGGAVDVGPCFSRDLRAPTTGRTTDSFVFSWPALAAPPLPFSSPPAPSWPSELASPPWSPAFVQGHILDAGPRPRRSPGRGLGRSVSRETRLRSM